MKVGDVVRRKRHQLMTVNHVDSESGIVQLKWFDEANRVHQDAFPMEWLEEANEPGDATAGYAHDGAAYEGMTVSEVIETAYARIDHAKLIARARGRSETSLTMAWAVLELLDNQQDASRLRADLDRELRDMRKDVKAQLLERFAELLAL